MDLAASHSNTPENRETSTFSSIQTQTDTEGLASGII